MQKIASIIRKVLNYQHKAITKTIENPVKRTQLEIDFEEKTKRNLKAVMINIVQVPQTPHLRMMIRTVRTISLNYLRRNTVIH